MTIQYIKAPKLIKYGLKFSIIILKDENVMNCMIEFINSHKSEMWALIFENSLLITGHFKCLKFTSM